MAQADLMGFHQTLDSNAAARTHALAVNRDYISQPRLSKTAISYSKNVYRAHFVHS